MWRVGNKKKWDCHYASEMISLPETSLTSLYRMDSEAHDYDVMEDLKANKLRHEFFPPTSSALQLFFAG